MKSKTLWFAAMVLLVVTAACGSKEFPAGVYKPAQPSPTDRIVEFEFTKEGTFAISYYNNL
jgi:predicted small lipoprotein YifL